jgi:hypothetical protein
MDPKLEQGLASIRDTIPRMWFAYYQGSVAAGFSPEQAFILLQTYILSQTPNGIQPPRTSGPEGDS